MEVKEYDQRAASIHDSILMEKLQTVRNREEAESLVPKSLHDPYFIAEDPKASCHCQSSFIYLFFSSLGVLWYRRSSHNYTRALVSPLLTQAVSQIVHHLAIKQ